MCLDGLFDFILTMCRAKDAVERVTGERAGGH